VFHAVTWQEGDFERSASVLSFASERARAAYPAQCSLRFMPISFDQKEKYLRDGRLQRLVLWDPAEPLKFVLRG
jgi:hypothetical protein